MRKSTSKTRTVRKEKPAAKAPRPARAVALKGTVAKGKARRGELRHVGWSSVEVETLNPLLGRQLVVGEKIMLARVLLKKGCVVPEHSHPNEQVTFILEGALKFAIGGKEIVVHAGEVLCIPSNMPHEAWALEDTLDLDVFTPPREDWLNKSDVYLRHDIPMK